MNLLKATLLLVASFHATKADHEPSLNAAVSAQLDEEEEDDELRNLLARIVNGNPASQTRYTYSVSLQDTRNTNEPHFCGGSLIAPDIVLTANTCVGPTNNLKRYKAAINPSTLTNQSGERFGFKSVVAHPEFNPQLLDHNLMIIKLDGTSTATYIRLNENERLPRISQTLTSMGWGETVRRTSEMSNKLRETTVNAITNGACDAVYASSGGISDDMLCAREPNQGPCAGDDGGPLIMRRKNASKDRLVGVLSWGEDCANPEVPGVYSRISYDFDWINEQVCKLSSNPPRYFGC